ncbi:excisionase family DNA-binding protein [Candidatus Poribacteria bacterium]|nr:excisionase family DNA-binding protein [Candidatus Poribacteria bacterium]
MTETMTTASAAQHFNVSERTIRRWIKSGKLQAEGTNGQRLVLLDRRPTECPNDRQMDNPVSSQLESENEPLRDLLQRADSEIQHLREQLVRRDEQIDHLTQLLAMQTKTTAVLTERLQASQDMRRLHWWKRLRLRFDERRHNPSVPR